ncbi:MAG: hypothetical protein NUV46_02715 [Nanoarchaeota archaeon]|nr:hypothetical protein [Nanoarchaeota archaeon]
MGKNINRSSITNILLAGVFYFSFTNTLDEVIQKKDENSDLPTPTQNTQISNEKPWDDFYFEQKLKNLEGKIEYKGGMNIKFLEDGREIKIPSWQEMDVEKSDYCSQYARKISTYLFKKRLKVIASAAWNLQKNNPYEEYSKENLEMGDIITLYNPKSRYKSKGRLATHAATYIGEDNEGKLYFAEQRGSSTRISTIEDFLEKGMKPVRIIKTEKISSIN